MSNEIPYLADASSRAQSKPWVDPATVLAALEGQGFWEETHEWRISTTTELRVETEAHRDRRWFRVSVVTGGEEMICRTPTLERALEYMGVFFKLERDLFWTLGWPDWAAKGRFNPEQGETLP